MVLLSHAAILLLSGVVIAVALLFVYKIATPQVRLAECESRIEEIRSAIAASSSPRETCSLMLAGIRVSLGMALLALPGAVLSIPLLLAALLVVEAWTIPYPLLDIDFFGWRPRWYWIVLCIALAVGLPIKKAMKIH